MQGLQYVAQKLTSTTLPRSAEVENSFPESSAKRTSGALGTGMSTSAEMAVSAAASAKPKIIFTCMITRIVAGLAAALVTWGAPAIAQLERLTQREALSGLKTALERGATSAVAQLGKADGFFGNPRVRIPIPESLGRTEKLVRRLGYGGEVDELVLAMNRAAEAAVPEARKLLLDSIRTMSARDAKAILTGGDTAGTEYFRKTSDKALYERFLPIVKAATEKVGVAQRYREFSRPAASLGLLKAEHADLDQYVTRKALEGLYLMLGEEEKKIRKDPLATGSAILRKVFGAL